MRTTLFFEPGRRRIEKEVEAEAGWSIYLAYTDSEEEPFRSKVTRGEAGEAAQKKNSLQPESGGSNRSHRMRRSDD